MIKLSKPYITDQCISNVVEVLRSGNLVQGQFVNQLENDVKSYLGERTNENSKRNVRFFGRM